jgi:endonuclease-3
MDQRAASRVLRILEEAYPDAGCQLNYSEPLELLLAITLSAQCTDERVNRVTLTLFNKYPTAKALAEAR